VITLVHLAETKRKPLHVDGYQTDISGHGRALKSQGCAQVVAVPVLPVIAIPRADYAPGSAGIAWVVVSCRIGIEVPKAVIDDQEDASWPPLTMLLLSAHDRHFQLP
jgi:hypothetical protein